MLLSDTKTAVVEKTEELCQTILDQPLFQEMKGRIETFTNDEEAQGLYRTVIELQEQLQEKQNGGFALEQGEIEAFEKERDALFASPVAKGFIDAQQHLHEVQDSIVKFVSKTLELGRLPTAEDLSSGGGCCGGGCGGGGGGGCG